MDPEVQKIISDQLKKLPKNVVDAIVSVDYKTKLQEITRRQKLLIDQAGKLEMETTLVMIGLEPLADFIANLQRELSLPIMRAKEVASDVSESIFKPIRDSLYAMNQEIENDTENEEVPEEKKPFEPLATHLSTNSNDPDLNREQILREIEDPSLIDETEKTKSVSPDLESKIIINKPKPTPVSVINDKLPVVEDSSAREIETLDEIPYQQDIKIKPTTSLNPNIDLVQQKMSGPTITSQQIVEAKPEVKLPSIEKKRPSSGIDPYREAIS